MSVLEYMDVFMMFLRELENREFDDERRQECLQQVIENLQGVLAGVPASPPPQQQYQQPPQQQQQQYQQPPQQQQQYQQPPPQQQQQYQQPPPQQQQQYQQPPPQQQQQQQQQYQQPPQDQGYVEPETAAANAQSDHDVLAAISTTVYGTGLRLMNVYKSMDVAGKGLDKVRFEAGLNKLGLKFAPGTIERVMEPWTTKGVLSYSGFIRMLASVGSQ
eukprot:TRINITY_DN67659_c8_g4_i1.p2 TRINITY_DN67659_c8_g4~~TRINITY_DN67659_c8_g4_i1.p2  ORF type:complete len:229 (-),score=149.73 TRINITY_DN67659_c8_g4_i1:65-715(-)